MVIHKSGQKVVVSDHQISSLLTTFRFMDMNQHNSNYSYHSHHVAYGRYPGALMGLTFLKAKLRKVRRALIYLHPVDMFPRGDRDFSLNLYGSRGVFDEAATYWVLSYAQVTLNLLPAPYPTNCRSFRSMSYESEFHCQQICLQRETLKRYDCSWRILRLS